MYQTFVLIVLSSSFAILQVYSFNNYKYSGNGNSGSPGFYWGSGYKGQYGPPQIQIETEANDSEDEDPEYMYELLFGHQIRDIEKYERQQGCLCNNRFRDPHCGTDNKLYDNGCYFECAQKRNPGLKLLNWGKC